MNERKLIEGKIRRDVGMEPDKAARRTAELLAGDDLYHICPDCNFKNVGTLADLEKGCVQCLV